MEPTIQVVRQEGRRLRRSAEWSSGRVSLDGRTTGRVRESPMAACVGEGSGRAVHPSTIELMIHAALVCE